MQRLTQKEIKRLQLDLLDDIDCFCKKNNLRYSLAYGTLLGAVRHHGFIPWDDDIDLMMPRPDYEFFRKKYSHDQYDFISVENSQDYLLFFGKAYDKRTFLIEKGQPQKYGLYIDIFPIDGVGDSPEKMHTQIKRIAFARNMVRYRHLSWHEMTFKFRLAGMVIKLIPEKFYVSIIRKSCLQYDYLHSNKVGVIYEEETSILDQLEYELMTEMKFEGKKYSVLQAWDKLLTQLYGDYMKLPPVEERVLKHNLQVFLKE